MHIQFDHTFRNIFKDCLTNRLLAVKLIECIYQIRVYPCVVNLVFRCHCTYIRQSPYLYILMSTSSSINKKTSEYRENMKSTNLIDKNILQ